MCDRRRRSGRWQIRKLEKIRGTTRVEFVCGLRAVRAARTDFRLFSEISRTLSTPFEEIPALIAAQIEKTKTLEKTSVRLSTELAKREGGELHAATAPGEDGIRRVTQKGPIDDAVRARAQAFIAGGKAVFLAVSEDPASVLLAASADSGVHAGNRVKEAVTAAGGRGGGNQTVAQGSVPGGGAERCGRGAELSFSRDGRAHRTATPEQSSAYRQFPSEQNNPVGVFLGRISVPSELALQNMKLFCFRFPRRRRERDPLYMSIASASNTANNSGHPTVDLAGTLESEPSLGAGHCPIPTGFPMDRQAIRPTPGISVPPDGADGDVHDALHPDRRDYRRCNLRRCWRTIPHR